MGGKPRRASRYYQVELEHPKTGERESVVVESTSLYLAEMEAREEASGFVDLNVEVDAWIVGSVAQLERCGGCGGLRKSVSPRGHGAVR